MDIQTIKALFDAFYQAKRIRELLPALPDGVTPTYIHILDPPQTSHRPRPQLRCPTSVTLCASPVRALLGQ